MTQTGVLAPRVVVQPPSVPAPPPISLLTQGTTIDPSGDTERWAGGGGATWLEPVRASDVDLWQQWSESGGTDDTTKSHDLEVSDADQAPTQLPIYAVLGIRQGALQAFSDEATGNSQDAQLARAMAAVLPRAIEHELWTGEKADAAGWLEQFRLADGDHVDVSHAGSTIGFLRALAHAEGLAADAGFVDSFGGVMVHVSWTLFSLLTSSARNLTLSPTGRQLRTAGGAVVVPEVGATGSWPGHGSAPGAGTLNDRTAGYLFVTPPVRVRLGRVETLASPYDLSNDRIVMAEQPFQLEASVLGSEHPTSIAVAVDYTQEY